MGTQRKNVEHVTFEWHFQRCTSNTKRMHNARAKLGSMDRTTLFGASDSGFVAGSSSENRRKIDRKSMKIHARSSKNRRKINLGPSWAPTAVSGTRPDALGTACRSPNDAPRPILGRPGRATDGRETSKSVPGRLPRCLRTVPEPGLSMFGANNTVECACGAIF